MLQIIIFSFNRAMQLDTLLTSFCKHWKSPSYQVDVIYNTSDKYFQKGYQRLMEKFGKSETILFHKESKGCTPYKISEIIGNLRNAKRFFVNPRIRNPKSNFRQMLIELMEQSKAKEVMFMTDDAMYINDVDVTESMIEWLESSSRHRQISLRLGAGMNNQPSNVRVGADGLMKWKMSDVNHMTNWGYRFSVDAHIYDKQLILEYYKKCIFINPNTLEGYIENMLYKQGLVNETISFSKPMLLSFPINMVQNESDNEHLGVDCEKLNRMYLDRYELVYPVPEDICMFQVYPETLSLFKDGKETVIKI